MVIDPGATELLVALAAENAYRDAREAQRRAPAAVSERHIDVIRWYEAGENARIMAALADRMSDERK